MLLPYDSDPLFSPFLHLLLISHVFAISKLNLNELGTVGCHLAGNSGNECVECVTGSSKSELLPSENNLCMKTLKKSYR